MVNQPDRLAARLGTRLGSMLLWGACAGVGLSCLAVLGLALGGRPLQAWPLQMSGWWDGPDWWLELLAGAGLLLLAATPVAMLVAIAVEAVRLRRWRSVAAAVGVGLVLTGGLVLASTGA